MTSEGDRVKLKLTETDGIMHLWCPGCDRAHPMHVAPRPVAWDWNGSLEAPTFSPSLLVYPHPGQPRCHSFITDGRIQFLADCEHALAGHTVDLPDWPNG